MGTVKESRATKTEKKWQAVIHLNGRSVHFKLDTGSEANVLPVTVYRQMKSVKLEKTKTLLYAFGEHQVVLLGTVKLDCTTEKGHKENLLFYVTSSTDVPILGSKACNDLNLVKRVYACQPRQCSSMTKKEMKHNYRDVFTGVGLYDKRYHMQLNPDVKGVIQPPRKIPYQAQPKLKVVLDKLKGQNIITDVDKSTEWVNNLVIVEKKFGALRLCLDLRPLNAAIKRERHVISTPADRQAQLSGKNIFTVVKLKDGYWHVKLSDESSYFCTFNTPWGRKRFLRIPFGISSASEIMQKRNEEILGDIQRVHVIADDLIIAATDDQEHDIIQNRVLQRARDKGVTFNSDKIQFKISEVEYMGNLVSYEGLKPDPKKIEAIINMHRLTDVTSLQRLLGMVKYLTQYIPNESDNLKVVLTRKPAPAFYDVTKPVTIQTDASQSGLGACILHKGKPVANASRAMTQAEQNSAQIKKEMLAICFATSKFH